MCSISKHSYPLSIVLTGLATLVLNGYAYGQNSAAASALIQLQSGLTSTSYNTGLFAPIQPSYSFTDGNVSARLDVAGVPALTTEIDRAFDNTSAGIRLNYLFAVQGKSNDDVSVKFGGLFEASVTPYTVFFGASPSSIFESYVSLSVGQNSTGRVTAASMISRTTKGASGVIGGGIDDFGGMVYASNNSLGSMTVTSTAGEATSFGVQESYRVPNFNTMGTKSQTGNFSGAIGIRTDSSGYGLGYVSLFTVASASGQGTGKVKTFVDPYLYIAPDYLLNNPGTSLTVLNGVGNSLPAPVPLQPTQAYLLAGLAAFAGLKRFVTRRSEKPYG